MNGLAWTSVGGTLLPLEVLVMEGTGKIELTGSLGDVMKESAKLRSALHARSHASMKSTPISIRTRTFIFTLPKALFQRTDLLPALL